VTTPASIRVAMSPYVNLVAFLDLACARRGNDGDDNRFWKRRKTSGGFRPSHLEFLANVEYTLEVLDSLGLVQVDAEGPLFPTTPLTLVDISRQEYCDRYISPYRGQFGALREKTPEGWLAGKTAVKTEIHALVKRLGLKLKNFNRGSTSYDNETLVRALVIARCISSQDRYRHWVATLFDDSTRQSIESRFQVPL
jgi:hypothetical protein